MKQFTFKSEGERLSINIQFGYAQIGSYILRLWEAGSNTVLMQRRGNNQNQEDDTYLLPLPTKHNDGRMIQCQTAVVAPDWKPGQRYSVRLIFRQGESEPQEYEVSGPIGESHAHPELFAVLKAIP